MSIDINKSLSQLEQKGWQDKVPNATDSFVIRNSYELYHKPLHEFDTEDLRFIIGQGVGLNYTVPMAIAVLKENLFAEGDYYEGDLLKNVLNVSSKYWANHPEQKKEVEQLFIANQQEFEELDTTEDIKNKIREAFEEFLLKK